MPGYSEFNRSGGHSKNRSRFRLPIKGFLLCAILLFPYGLLKAVARSDHRPLPVTLHVAVSDRNGEPVENLQANDFQVFEKKKLQKITRFRFERNAPVSLGVLVDVSKSMEGDGIRLALKLLKRLAAKLESPDELFVNAFSNESQELLDYMAPEDYLEDTIDNLGTGGRPHMGQALDLALIKLRDASNSNRAILFISSGRDIAGPATWITSHNTVIPYTHWESRGPSASGQGSRF